MTGRRQAERAERYLFEAAHPLSVVEATPSLVEPEPIVIYERNPRGLAIHHQDGRCSNPEGGCRPRLTSLCSGCRRTLVLCMVTADEMRAIKRGGWRCGDCTGVH